MKISIRLETLPVCIKLHENEKRSKEKESYKK